MSNDSQYIEPNRPVFAGYSSPNYTMVPDELFDEQLPDLSGAELKALLYIMRRTLGFKKGSDNISLNQLLTGIVTKSGERLDRGTGLSRSALVTALKSLVEKNLIIAERRDSPDRGYEATNYRLNVLYPTALRVAAPPSTKIELGQYENRTSLVRKSNQQETVLQETVRQDFVVVAGALQVFGISKKAADQLAHTYPEDYLLGKLDLVQWLLDSKNPLVTTNPAGYLRKAIEEDYTPPKGYKSKAQREAEAQRKAQEDEQQREQREQLRRDTEAAFQQAREEAKEQLREQIPSRPIAGSRLTTESAWKRVLSRMREQMSQATFQTWLADTRLVEVEDQRAVVAVPTRFAVEWLEKRYRQQLEEALGEVVGWAVATAFMVIPDYDPRSVAESVRISPTEA